MEGAKMQTKKVTKTGKQMGKKVMATDAAQDVTAVLVDHLEKAVADKADDVGENVKARAARAGGRSPKSTTAKKSSARKSGAKRSPSKKAGAKKSAARKRSSRKSTAKKSAARKRSSRKSTAKRSAGRKSTAKRSTAKRR
jgi:hypothetical protein